MTKEAIDLRLYHLSNQYWEAAQTDSEGSM